ncbi:MAG TPA: TIGR02996 domain-containing protein [Myxococcaceae bacterium]|nr:TIGR02996 domain-containing protein [Myxococcaceae bacterium]
MVRLDRDKAGVVVVLADGTRCPLVGAEVHAYEEAGFNLEGSRAWWGEVTLHRLPEAGFLVWIRTVHEHQGGLEYYEYSTSWLSRDEGRTWTRDDTVRPARFNEAPLALLSTHPQARPGPHAWPEPREGHLIVPVQRIKALGFTWPGERRIAELCVLVDGAVDLDATLAALENDLPDARASYDQMVAFARMMGAPVDETTSLREQIEGRYFGGQRGIERLRAIRQSVLQEPLPAELENDRPRASDADLRRLLDAVLAAPDDDAPRLAYADALTDDKTRARFIHQQCELARLPDRHPRVRYLGPRVWSALKFSFDEWSWELLRYARVRSFERGFPEELELSGRDFAQHADAIARLAPVRKLYLRDGLDALAACPGLSRIQHLQVEATHLPGLGKLARSEHAGQLKSLQLGLAGGSLDQKSAEALASSPTLASLRKLLIGSGKFDALALALGNATGLPVLDEVSIGPIERAASIAAMLRGPLASRLRVLWLQGSTEAETLGSGPFPALEELSLAGRAPADFPGAPYMRMQAPRLRRLRLDNVLFNAESAQALADAAFPELRDLELSSARVDDTAASIIARAPWLPRLERLAIVGLNPLTRDGAEALLAAAPSLQTVALLGGPQQDMAAVIAHAPAASSLRDVTLSGEGIAQSSLEALLALPRLEVIDLLLQVSETFGNVIRKHGFTETGGCTYIASRFTGRR